MSEIENGGGNGGGAHGNGAGNGVGAAVSLAALAKGGKHVSAFLLRRMAEAVDGFRGESVVCRARFTPNEKFDFEVLRGPWQERRRRKSLCSPRSSMICWGSRLTR